MKSSQTKKSLTGTELVKVFETGSHVNAHFVMGFLESADIPSTLFNESIRWYPECGIGQGGIKVMVPVKYVEEAKVLVADLCKKLKRKGEHKSQ